MPTSTPSPNTITVPTQVVEVKEVPRDIPSLAWSMLDKVAQGSTAVIFALIILWWFSRKAISRSVDKFNNLLDTLSQSTRDNSITQQALAQTQEKLNTTLQDIGNEDIRTAQILGKMNSKLGLIRTLLIEVRSYQTGIPQNRLQAPYLDVLDADDADDSGLGN